jgi:DNA-binding response OmpR family regulator
MKILLVEDEKELSQALAKMLTKDGYEVDAVYDGADGLAYASTGMYDIVLLDVIMPKMNGFEVLSALRSKKRNAVSRARFNFFKFSSEQPCT